MSEFKIFGRIAFPHVHTPHAFNPGEKEQYRAKIVVPADDPTAAAIMAEAAALIAAEIPGAQVRPENMPVKQAGNDVNAPGCVVLNAKSDYRPAVVGPDLKPLMDGSRPADGDYCWFNVGLYTFKQMGGGVGVGLNGVMFSRIGEGPLGAGQKSAESMFGDVAGQPQTAAPAATPAAQPAVQQTQRPF